MTLSDPAEGRATPHAGHRWAWVEEPTEGRGAWRTVSTYESRQCRWTVRRERCVLTSVAKLLRGDPNRIGRRSTANDWWHYCGDHLYGRVVHDGKVWSARLVPEGSDRG